MPPTKLQGYSNPSYRIASTYGVAAYKARFALWELYTWVNDSSAATIVATKTGSVWTSPSTLADNDWFVARWGSPSTGKVTFDLWVQATDSANLNVPPLSQRGLFVRAAHHSSNAAWNGTGGAYGTPYFKSGSQVLPVSDQMARVNILDQVGGARSHTMGDANFLTFAIDPSDDGTLYEGFWVGNLIPYSSLCTVPLALTCGNMRRLGTTGLSGDTDISGDYSGVVTRTLSIEPIRLPYMYGSIISSYSQPIEFGPAPGNTVISEMPIPVGSKSGPSSFDVIGYLTGVAWSYGKTNEVIDQGTWHRIIMSDVVGGEYRCYGAVSFPSNGTSPGSSLPFSCMVGP